MGGWDRRQWRVLAAALSGVFITLFPFLMIVAALPEMAKGLHTSESTLAWAITAPMLAGAVLLPTAGRLGDLYGHRRLFLTGLTISGVFGLLSALAWNPLSLIAFRTIGQTAGSAASPAAIALAISAFGDEDRSRVLGFWAMSTAFAPALGLLVGGPVVDALGWRGLFVLQAALVVVVLPLAVTSLTETARRRGVSFDIAGGVAFMATTGALVFALDRAGHWRWGHPAVIVGFLLVPVAAVRFWRTEHRARDPILPPSLVRHRDFAASCACELLIQIPTNGALFVLPLVFVDHYGAGVSRVAFYLAPMPIGMALVAPFGGALAQRIGERTCAVGGSVLLALAFAAVVGFDQADAVAGVLLAWFVVGVANGLIRPAIASAAAAALEPAYYGAGMATTRMVSTVGAAAGITLMVSLLPNGFTAPLVVCAVSSALAAVAGAGLATGGEPSELLVAVEPLA